MCAVLKPEDLGMDSTSGTYWHFVKFLMHLLGLISFFIHEMKVIISFI